VKPFIPFVALACALAAAPAAAQDAPAGPTSLSLQLGGGYAVGVWRDLSPRMRTGIEVGTSVSRIAGDGTEEDYTNYTVQPTLKLFSGADGSLRPYAMLGLYAQGYGQRAENTDVPAESEFSRREVGARVGVGMEWMPVARVGVGGHVGVGGGYMESRSGGSFGDDRIADGWTAATFSSGIVVHLFF
jgi:hypothetical protein